MTRDVNNTPAPPSVRCAVYTRKAQKKDWIRISIPWTSSGNRPKPISPANGPKAGFACPSDTTTAASPAATWIGPRWQEPVQRSPPATLKGLGLFPRPVRHYPMNSADAGSGSTRGAPSRSI
jgi:hypothetical protein